MALLHRDTRKRLTYNRNGKKNSQILRLLSRRDVKNQTTLRKKRRKMIAAKKKRRMFKRSPSTRQLNHSKASQTL